jgi:hypothetical protein
VKTGEELGLPLERTAAPDLIHGSVAGGREDPGAGILGGAFAGPASEGRRECILEGVLGELEVAEDADEDRQAATPLLPEDGLDYAGLASAGICMIGRTSTLPGGTAAGIFDAHSIASSIDSTSIR